jgi:hypothetical protein
MRGAYIVVLAFGRLISGIKSSRRLLFERNAIVVVRVEIVQLIMPVCD